MKKIVLLPFSLFIAMQITFCQNVGIGTTTPTAKLEIKGDGSTNATNALMIKNSSGDTLLRMRNNGNIQFNFNGPVAGRTLNIGGNGINFYRNDTTFSGSIWPTDTSLVIWSQQSDNDYVILQPAWGKVGIGTYGPRATFEVKGDMILGDGGTAINKVLKATVTKDIGSVAAGVSNTQTFTVTNAKVGSTVYISPESALPNGLLIAYARVSTANTIEVKFFNVTAAAINPASMDFFITVIE